MSYMQRQLSLLPRQQFQISCHSSKRNLEMRGIRSYAGSFIFVMGKERADLAAASEGKGINHLVPVIVPDDTVAALHKPSDPVCQLDCGIAEDNQYLYQRILWPCERVALHKFSVRKGKGETQRNKVSPTSVISTSARGVWYISSLTTLLWPMWAEEWRPLRFRYVSVAYNVLVRTTQSHLGHSEKPEATYYRQNQYGVFTYSPLYSLQANRNNCSWSAIRCTKPCGIWRLEPNPTSQRKPVIPNHDSSGSQSSSWEQFPH